MTIARYNEDRRKNERRATDRHIKEIQPRLNRKIIPFVVVTIFFVVMIVVGMKGLLMADGNVALMSVSVGVLILSFFPVTLIIHRNLIALHKANIRNVELLNVLESRMAAIEAASDGIGIIDKDNCLIYMNRALRHLHKMTKEQALAFYGQDWRELYNEVGAAHIDRVVLPIMARQNSWHGETPLWRKDGSVIHTEMSLTRLADGGMVGTVRDRTEQITLQKEHENLQAQMMQAQKMEALGRIAGGIAHDFNNILASIAGYAGFLVDDLERGTKAHGYASNVQKASESATELINNMMTFSRIKPVTRKTVMLAEVIQDMLSMLKPGLPPTVEIDLDYAADMQHAAVLADHGQLVQSLLNICVNALDAMEGRSGSLVFKLETLMSGYHAGRAIHLSDSEKPTSGNAIAIRQMEEGHARLVIGSFHARKTYHSVSVEDTGGGIPYDTLSKMFEPFFTTKAIDKGTGLGLANVHGTVLSNEGIIVVDTMIGEGTCFTLFFPAADVENIEDAPLEEMYQCLPIYARILVVEDQADVLHMLADMLERFGCQVGKAETGQQALEILEDQDQFFDCVISDENMPEVTGLTMAERICALRPALPVLLITAGNIAKVQRKAKAVRCIKAVLSKPVSPATLYNALKKILEN